MPETPGCAGARNHSRSLDDGGPERAVVALCRMTMARMFLTSIAVAVAAGACGGAQTRAEVPPGMVWIPGGTFRMGCADCGMPDAAPVHPVAVDGFWIDATPVTNAQFDAFVRATGYVTIAERKP